MPDEYTWELRDTNLPALSDGQMLVKNYYVSLDPAMRGWIRNVPSYLPPVAIGAVMRAGTVGQVVESKHSEFNTGDFVVGMGGVQQYSITQGKGFYKVDPDLAALPKYLSVLGMTGLTAYFGLLDIGKPKTGETILVSGAAGAVGSVAGQIGKIKGCRVVGIAGGREKCNYLLETLGFDEAIDYKHEILFKRLRETCPDGIDVYFDNVGGQILDITLTKINRKARIVLCGGISQYNVKEIAGPKNYLSMLVNRARMEGFIVFDYVDQYESAAREMATWMQAGKLQSFETIVEGIEQFYTSFLRLFSGEKMGKLILKIDE